MRFSRILLLCVVGMLGACVSGAPKSDSYTDHNGVTTLIQSDRELCVSSCNDDYSRCMDTDDAKDNGGVNGPAGMFGASADCRNSLKKCLPSCKGR